MECIPKTDARTTMQVNIDARRADDWNQGGRGMSENGRLDSLRADDVPDRPANPLVEQAFVVKEKDEFAPEARVVKRAGEREELAIGTGRPRELTGSLEPRVNLASVFN